MAQPMAWALKVNINFTKDVTMKKIMNKSIIRMSQEGFTLIEILMAVLIIVILAVVGITQFSNFAADAKNAATKSNLAILRNAIGTKNALERIRCAKTSRFFPNVVTLQSNDITGCLCSATVPCQTIVSPVMGSVVQAGETAANGAVVTCDPTNLIDPATNATIVGGCVTTAASAMLTLVPAVDRPFVQGTIPNNPWTGPAAVNLPNLVTEDVEPVSAVDVDCLDSPLDTPGSMAIATLCATGTSAGVIPDGTTLHADAIAGAGLVTQAGWCYCQTTGKIWANTGNNDGLSSGTGTESEY